MMVKIMENKIDQPLFEPQRLIVALEELINILMIENALLNVGKQLDADVLSRKSELSQITFSNTIFLSEQSSVIDAFTPEVRENLRMLAQKLRDETELNKHALEKAMIFSEDVVQSMNEYVIKNHEKARVYGSNGQRKGVYLQKMPPSVRLNDSI